jgi:hypothetical protein
MPAFGEDHNWTGQIAHGLVAYRYYSIFAAEFKVLTIATIYIKKFITTYLILLSLSEILLQLK